MFSKRNFYSKAFGAKRKLLFFFSRTVSVNFFVSVNITYVCFFYTCFAVQTTFTQRSTEKRSAANRRNQSSNSRISRVRETFSIVYSHRAENFIFSSVCPYIKLSRLEYTVPLLFPPRPVLGPGESVSRKYKKKKNKTKISRARSYEFILLHLQTQAPSEPRICAAGASGIRIYIYTSRTTISRRAR